MSNTTDNFWSAFSQPDEIDQYRLFYRLYYNDQGNPLFYSMEDLPGNYVEIDVETYTQSSGHVRVVNGQLVKITAPATTKLVPADSGTCCDPTDVCVIVSEAVAHVKWNIKTYESN